MSCNNPQNVMKTKKAIRKAFQNQLDGKGFSLTLVSPQTVDPNSLGDKAAWRPSVNRGGSPGAAD